MVPRVFVSSVVRGYESYREAARRAIITVSADPVLINEDFPAMIDSSRNACLDGVKSADIFILVIGNRGGWRAPSGKLVVEEELEYAQKIKLPVLVFLQEVARDDDAERLVKQVSDYIDGVFRKTFVTETELEREITEALSPLVKNWKPEEMQQDELDKLLASPYKLEYQAMLRFVLLPEREEELIDPVTVVSEGFLRSIYGIGHAADVALLDYEQSKQSEHQRSSLVIIQEESHNRSDAVDVARIEVMENGRVIIDANITGRVMRGDRHSSLNSYVIATEDVEDVLRRCFRFADSFYNEYDRHRRHQRFYYDCCFSNVGPRRLERNPQDRSSYQVPWRREDKPIVVFGKGRTTSRDDLKDPKEEIARILVCLQRALRD